jgi:hypothetical protein
MGLCRLRKNIMSKLTASADGGAMPEGHKTRRDLPPFESELFLFWYVMCHRRMQALYRVAEGRPQPDDPSLVSAAETCLANHGWTPRDFGFVDPPTFDVNPRTENPWAALDTAIVN